MTEALRDFLEKITGSRDIKLIAPDYLLRAFVKEVERRLLEVKGEKWQRMPSDTLYQIYFELIREFGLEDTHETP